MTKIKVEEVISQGEYIKRLIDEQGVDNLFATQVTYLDDRTVIKLDELETKDYLSFTHDGDKFVIKNEIEIDEDTILKNIIVRYFKPYSLSTMINYYSNTSISYLLYETPLEIKEIYYLDDAMNTHLIWEYREMV